jgi:hypothetical protein
MHNPIDIGKRAPMSARDFRFYRIYRINPSADRPEELNLADNSILTFSYDPEPVEHDVLSK